MDENTNISARIYLKPELSQISIIVLLIISGISFLSSFYFIWNDKNWALPAIVGSVFLILASIGWWRSQRVIDLANSSPTEISNNNGLMIRTDTRAIESENAVRNLAQLLEIIAIRNPLPKASGIINTDGSIKPNSEDESNIIIDSINEKISNISNELENNIFVSQKKSLEDIQNFPIDIDLEKHSGFTQ